MSKERYYNEVKCKKCGRRKAKDRTLLNYWVIVYRGDPFCNHEYEIVGE